MPYFTQTYVATSHESKLFFTCLLQLCSVNHTGINPEVWVKFTHCMVLLSCRRALNVIHELLSLVWREVQNTDTITMKSSIDSLRVRGSPYLWLIMQRANRVFPL